MYRNPPVGSLVLRQRCMILVACAGFGMVSPQLLPPLHTPNCCWGGPAGSAALPAPGQGAGLEASGLPETNTCT